MIAFYQLVGATLMITQSFLYNAIFFTHALVLINFYDVPTSKVPVYGLAFSIGNLCGPRILGPLFDSWGPQADDRRYLHRLRGAAGLVCHLLRRRRPERHHADHHVGRHLLLRLRRRQRGLPDRVRDLARSRSGRGYRRLLRHRRGRRRPRPAFYGALIGNGSSRTGLFVGYLIGAGMLIGGLVEVFLGVRAAGKSLEQITKPVASVAEPAPAVAVTP